MSLLRALVRRHSPRLFFTRPIHTNSVARSLRPIFPILQQRQISTSRPRSQGPNVQQVTGIAAQEDESTTKLEAPDYLSEGELQIFNKLKLELEPIKLEVQDISGGCGSMYGLDIVSSKFAGLSVIKQHQLVNRVLKEEISKWHGVQLKTKAP